MTLLFAFMLVCIVWEDVLEVLQAPANLRKGRILLRAHFEEWTAAAGTIDVLSVEHVPELDSERAMKAVCTAICWDGKPIAWIRGSDPVEEAELAKNLPIGMWMIHHRLCRTSHPVYGITRGQLK